MAQGRPLTHDEQKAAEAAFSGRPFNTDWTGDAKIVYDGLVDAMSSRQMDSEFATSPYVVHAPV